MATYAASFDPIVEAFRRANSGRVALAEMGMRREQSLMDLQSERAYKQGEADRQLAAEISRQEKLFQIQASDRAAARKDQEGADSQRLVNEWLRQDQLSEERRGIAAANFEALNAEVEKDQAEIDKLYTPTPQQINRLAKIIAESAVATLKGDALTKGKAALQTYFQETSGKDNSQFFSQIEGASSEAMTATLRTLLAEEMKPQAARAKVLEQNVLKNMDLLRTFAPAAGKLSFPSRQSAPGGPQAGAGGGLTDLEAAARAMAGVSAPDQGPPALSDRAAAPDNRPTYTGSFPAFGGGQQIIPGGATPSMMSSGSMFPPDPIGYLVEGFGRTTADMARGIGRGLTPPSLRQAPQAQQVPAPPAAQSSQVAPQNLQGILIRLTQRGVDQNLIIRTLTAIQQGAPLGQESEVVLDMIEEENSKSQGTPVPIQSGMMFQDYGARPLNAAPTAASNAYSPFQPQYRAPR